MSERAFQKMMAPAMRRLGNMIARGTVVLADAAAKMQRLQVKLLADEAADGLEHFEPYGFTSKPKQGAEVVALFLDGDKSHGVVIVAADRRYRLVGLEDGEAALYDDQGQCVHLQRDGRIHVKALTKLTIEVPDAEITGNLKVGGDVVADGHIKDAGGTKSMAGMRATFNGHRHGGSATPDQSM